MPLQFPMPANATEHCHIPLKLPSNYTTHYYLIDDSSEKEYSEDNYARERDVCNTRLRTLARCIIRFLVIRPD